MPVWHERMREWRESGELAIVGIVQEQHPERTRLFAQWKQLDWPILWDPFNETTSNVVPNVVAVDEHGIVRAVNPDIETFGATFLLEDFEAPKRAATTQGTESGAVLEANAPRAAQDPLHEARRMLMRDVQTRTARSLSSPSTGADGAATTEVDGALQRLLDAAGAHPGDGAASFAAGVALRMRSDGPRARPDDFRRALASWQAALALDPNQYIWRRRIQQYGPRMDKPYNFYSWVEEAIEQVRLRGDEPVIHDAALTPAELAFPRKAFAGERAEEPDPEGRIAKAEPGWLTVETAVAFATADRPETAAVHLALRLDRDQDVHWTNDAGPLQLYVADVPAGCRLSRSLFEQPAGGSATSNEIRRFGFELELDEPLREPFELRGYVLFYACEGRQGQCVYRRQDFVVPVVPTR